MEEEILGSISPLARGIKAETHDLAVVTVESTPKVKQLGNILPTSTRDNPNQGRVYDTLGLSPGITDVSKGGGREPMIVENIPCKLDKCKNGQFLSAEEHGICDIGTNIASTVTARHYKGLSANKDNMCIVAMRGRNPDNPSDRTAGNPTEQRLEPNSQGICNTLTSVQKDNMLLEQSILQTPRGYNSGGRHKICPPITSCSFHENNFLFAQYRIRKLTPLECWRLMGFSDEDFLSAKLGSRKAAKETLAKYPHLGRRAFTEVQRIEKMSNSQLYKQAGNSIVKNVLTAIFAQLIEMEV